MPLVHKISNILTKCSAATTAILLVSGCQSISLPSLPNFSSEPVPGPAMAPAPLPAFYEGDKYYYSNGSRDQVVSVNGETLNMISRSKRKLANFRNFILPPPYVEGTKGEYYKESDVPTNALWPLTIGAKTQFETKGRTVTKPSGNVSEYYQRWQCEVEGTERVRVLAGEFDTYRVKCQRFSTKGRWWQNRTWNYAPDLGAYVLRRDFYKSGAKSRIRPLQWVSMFVGSSRTRKADASGARPGP